MICPICNKENSFGPVLSAGARESMICSECGSTSRGRAMWRSMVKAANPQTASIWQVGKDALTERYRKYATYFVCSELRPKPGDTYVISQNLEKLTFDDNLFDIVLCSDVLEHVRLYWVALMEIYRVLRDKGTLVMTVPLTSFEGHKKYCETGETPEKDKWLPDTPVHLDPLSEGCKVYREFDPLLLIEEMEALGYEITIDDENDVNYGIINSLSFRCRKKGAAK
jgi:predicted SAM-dependent methyltransferase